MDGISCNSRTAGDQGHSSFSPDQQQVGQDGQPENELKAGFIIFDDTKDFGTDKLWTKIQRPQKSVYSPSSMRNHCISCFCEMALTKTSS